MCSTLKSNLSLKQLTTEFAFKNPAEVCWLQTFKCFTMKQEHKQKAAV